MNIRIRPGILSAAAYALTAAFARPAMAADDLPGYIWASSVLYEPGFDYEAWCAMDHDISTAWTEGAEGSGYGESLYFETDPYAVITGGVICPGYYANEDLFYKNNAPTRIYIHTGTQGAYLDVTEYASAYQEGFGGFHFLFDEPLISDGSVTMTIVGVRKGWKYDDTCISELRLEGYQGSADMLPADSGGTDHVSLILPDEDYDGYDDSMGNPFLNPDGLGGDGRGPEETQDTREAQDTKAAGNTNGAGETGTHDADDLDDGRQTELVNFANQLYALHNQDTMPHSVTILSEDLYSYSRAYMLNWYQSSAADDRISYGEGPDYNYAAEYDLRAIDSELFNTPDAGADIQTLCDYFGAVREGERIRMKAGGNGWYGARFYLNFPDSAGDMQGRTLLMGKVMTYDAETGESGHAGIYYAYFKQDAYDPSVYRFDSLYVEIY